MYLQGWPLASILQKSSSEAFPPFSIPHLHVPGFCPLAPCSAPLIFQRQPASICLPVQIIFILPFISNRDILSFTEEVSDLSCSHSPDLIHLGDVWLCLGFLFSLTRQFENIYRQFENIYMQKGFASGGEPSPCCGARYRGIVWILLSLLQCIGVMYLFDFLVSLFLVPKQWSWTVWCHEQGLREGRQCPRREGQENRDVAECEIGKGHLTSGSMSGWARQQLAWALPPHSWECKMSWKDWEDIEINIPHQSGQV